MLRLNAFKTFQSKKKTVARVTNQLDRMLSAALGKIVKDLALLNKIGPEVDSEVAQVWTNRRMVNFYITS